MMATSVGVGNRYCAMVPFDHLLSFAFEMQTGKMLQEVQVHEEAIQDMQMSPDETHVITASLDKTGRLIDVETFQVLKTYKTGRFVQSAAMSPVLDHVSVV